MSWIKVVQVLNSPLSSHPHIGAEGVVEDKGEFRNWTRIKVEVFANGESTALVSRVSL